MMRWDIKTILAIIVLCGIVAGLTLLTGKASALCPSPPTTCQLVDKNGQLQHYHLEINSITIDQKEVWPIPEAGVFKWSYKLWTDDPLYPIPSINQVLFLAPNCCGDLIYSVPTGSDILEPGIGDPTTYFGVGNYQDYVIRLSYANGGSNPPINYFTDKLSPFQTTSVQIKAGKSYFYCRSIAGPACAQQDAIVVTEKKVYNPKRKMWICSDVDPFSGCETNLTDCATGKTLTPVPLSTIVAGSSGSPSPISQIAVDGAKCPTVDIDTTGSNTWYRCSGGWCWY
jgi:hypothetical protein